MKKNKKYKHLPININQIERYVVVDKMNNVVGRFRLKQTAYYFINKNKECRIIDVCKEELPKK